jgi:hypothetical protein
MSRFLGLLAATGILLYAQTLSGNALVQALRQGGYVIVMRHASSPREAPDKQTANPDNLKPERQLDAEGRATAAAMGKALRDLKIPIGELGDNGQSMQGGTEAQATWLQKKVTQFPAGTNTLLITHLPNISGAFPQLGPAPADGEALVFGPDGKGGATVVARIKIDDWPRM